MKSGKFFCQKATGSWEFGPEIIIFVWSRYLKYNLLEMLLPAHGYFNVHGHFLGLDYMTKNQRLAFGAARNHGSKVWKLNFQANFECLCHNTSPLILLLKWKSSIYSITVGIFCYKAINIQYLNRTLTFQKKFFYLL